MKTLAYLTAFILMTYGCRKDNIECPPITEKPCVGGDYNKYSTDNFDYVKQTLPSYSTTPTTNFTWLGKYKYDFPVFNKNNAFEFIYSRSDTGNYDLNTKLFKFSFCSGKNIKIADNVKGLDWGTNGWILGRNDFFESFRLKANGDSLQQMLTSEVGIVGKWNPSCTFYYVSNGQDCKIMNTNQTLYKTIPISPFDWLNDSTLIYQSSNKSLVSFNIATENNVVVNSNLNSYGIEKLFSESNNTVYIFGDHFDTIGYGNVLKCAIDGTNQVDTIVKTYPSYYLRNCSAIGTKLVGTLVRQNWKDSLHDSRFIRNNILIMDLDGTNQRLVNLP